MPTWSDSQSCHFKTPGADPRARERDSNPGSRNCGLNGDVFFVCLDSRKQDEFQELSNYYWPKYLTQGKI